MIGLSSRVDGCGAVEVPRSGMKNFGGWSLAILLSFLIVEATAIIDSIIVAVAVLVHSERNRVSLLITRYL